LSPSQFLNLRCSSVSPGGPTPPLSVTPSPQSAVFIILQSNMMWRDAQEKALILSVRARVELAVGNPRRAEVPRSPGSAGYTGPPQPLQPASRSVLERNVTRSLRKERLRGGSASH